MPPAQLRKATRGDVPGIAAVLRDAWPQKPVRSEQLKGFLSDPESLMLVAVAWGQVLGLAAAFATRGSGGTLRWEVDLLAVREAARSRGLAVALLESVVALGAERGAALARALVRVDNQPAERAFARTGFRPMRVPLALLVSLRPGRPEAEPPERAHRVPVNTPLYRGVWLEGDLSPPALDACRARFDASRVDQVGGLIPAGDVTRIEAAREIGYQQVGIYRWWQFDLLEPMKARHDALRGHVAGLARKEPGP